MPDSKVVSRVSLRISHVSSVGHHMLQTSDGIILAPSIPILIPLTGVRFQFRFQCKIMSSIPIPSSLNSPICDRLLILHIGSNAYRFRYISFADMGYICWYRYANPDCYPPHEVRKGKYWIRHRLSVRLHQITQKVFVNDMATTLATINIVKCW